MSKSNVFVDQVIKDLQDESSEHTRQSPVRVVKKSQTIKGATAPGSKKNVIRAGIPEGPIRGSTVGPIRGSRKGVIRAEAPVVEQGPVRGSTVGPVRGSKQAITSRSKSGSRTYSDIRKQKRLKVGFSVKIYDTLKKTCESAGVSISEYVRMAVLQSLR